VENDSSKARCTVSKTTVNAKYCDLISHSKTKKHINASGTTLQLQRKNIFVI